MPKLLYTNKKMFNKLKLSSECDKNLKINLISLLKYLNIIKIRNNPFVLYKEINNNGINY